MIYVLLMEPVFVTITVTMLLKISFLELKLVSNLIVILLSLEESLYIKAIPLFFQKGR